jgi:hypothetical protein
MEYEDAEDRRIFGVPAVLTSSERASLLADLSRLWRATYGRELNGLDDDLELCRRFFDPLTRGYTLRERLTEVSAVETDLAARIVRYAEPLIVSAGDGVLIVGVEARLTIELLQDLRPGRAHVVIPLAAASDAERKALEVYRRWTLSRLRQVIDLRSGAGKEVMQAVAVGLVLALLINRSDSLERAVVQWDNTTADGRDVDQAMYIGAEKFAEVLTSKRGRSSAEQRLKGGYALTEARRRLAHRLVVVEDAAAEGARIYIPAKYRDEVISFLARDLARRATLEAETLDAAFDRLVMEFRAAARALAYRSMVFERPADTDDLRRQLLMAFTTSKSANARELELSSESSTAQY